MKRNTLPCLLFTLVLSLFTTGVYAQPNYNQTPEYVNQNSVWALYRQIKVDMKDGSIAYPNTMTSGDEGLATVSDPNTGELLFYSNGGTCWNRNDAVMPNGSGLLGNSINGYYSGAQGVCIVPMPGDTQKYYLFSLESSGLGEEPTSVKLYYSIVDMSLDNGLGDIVAASKNIILDGASLLSEAMLAVQGDNCDVWLMLHTWQTPTFKAYHITSSGIDPTPVISTTGEQIQGTTTIGYGPSFSFTQDAYMQATIAVSPDRTRLSLSCWHIANATANPPILSTTGRSWGALLCDFNAATGAVSNAMLIDTMGNVSAAFSPDNSKLYTTRIIPNMVSPTYYTVTQLDISSNDSATIVGSAV